MTLFQLVVGGAFTYGFTVAACKASDYVMATPSPKPKPAPNNPNAGRDGLFARVNTVANWMFAATGIVLALGWLLHNCSDFTPWISR